MFDHLSRATVFTLGLILGALIGASLLALVLIAGL